MGHSDQMLQGEQEWAELYDDRKQQELALCQRIARGIANYDDALYVAWLCGLTQNFQKDAGNEPS